MPTAAAASVTAAVTAAATTSAAAAAVVPSRVAVEMLDLSQDDILQTMHN